MENFKKTISSLKSVLKIIAFTDLAAIVMLFSLYRESLGWILGTIGSATNLVWMSYETRRALDLSEEGAKTRTIKTFYFRYLFLIFYSVAAIVLGKIDILVYGFGLVSAQLTLVFQELFFRER